MESRDKPQAILYAAKSTQDTRGSIPGQLEDGRGFARREGLEVVAEYSEQDVSAYKGNRGPELASALDHVERIKGTLIAQHSDRLARGDGTQARHLVEVALWARKAGVRIICVQDPSTFESLVLAAAMGERNMEDSRRKGAAVAAGIARRRAAGRPIGPRSFGFTWRRDENDERVIVPDPEQAPVVKRIFDSYLGGTTQFQIARSLNADRIPTLRGSMWKPTVVRTILANPLHAGLVRDGDKLIEGCHEPIIPRARWEKAQALRAARKSDRPPGRPSTGRHLFRKGFLRCGECGQAMITRTERNADCSLYEIYRCHGHYLDPSSCTMTPCRRDPIDSAVYLHFSELGLEAEATRRGLSEAVEHRLFDLRELHDAADHKAEMVAARLRGIKDDYLSEELTAAEWRELRDGLQPEADARLAERDQLQAELGEVEAILDVSVAESELQARLKRLCAAIAAGVDDVAGVEDVRRALLDMFDSFVLHKGPIAETGAVSADMWIEAVIGQSGGEFQEPRPVVVKKVLRRLSRRGSEWRWARLLGPIPVSYPPNSD